ncbi:IclR family transcriptional regulator [Peterkaempfera bronchialis]|uniref:Glycerol operon regulatory protein n=1 Tax=Peterkaempfera bronchialis TaxID=2126346 RepID=A0A345T4U8_9ACTN|nr:IclR family transcriptional regulator [Peterkaempfera bronchialis]AXI81003.1 IclR family transcriptional regulator [Peterkaempfera bronchialis]
MIQAVQRAVHVLRELATATPQLGVTALADRIGVSKPTAHALLRTLEREGLVCQDPETARYQLGPGLVVLGNAYLDSHELRARAAAWADHLAGRVDSAVWVGVLNKPDVLVIHHQFRPGDALQTLETGASLPWNTCALGKAIVAFLPADQREQLLGGELYRVTSVSVDDPLVLKSQLDGVRRTGYALDDQELTLGDAGIAAPVFDRTGLVAGALGLVGPVERLLADDMRRDYAIAVREVARGVSRDLGAPRTAGLSASM